MSERLSVHQKALSLRYPDDPPCTARYRDGGLEPPDFRSLTARQRLVWRGGFYAADYLPLQSRADWRGVHPLVRYHAGRVLTRAKAMGIPLYVRDAMAMRPRMLFPYEHREGRAFRILHCRYHDALCSDEWTLLAHMLFQEEPKTSLPGSAVIPWLVGNGGPGVCFWDDLDMSVVPPLAKQPVRLTPLMLLKCQPDDGDAWQVL